MERVFLDANILVSAALKPESSLGRLWRFGDVRLLGSPHVIEEARRNVHDPAAKKRLEALIADLAVLPNEPAEFEIEGDPDLPDKDRPVLLGAIVAGADVLLTGDLTHFGPLMGERTHRVHVSLPGDFLRRHTP